jgi:hypothetical protein
MLLIYKACLREGGRRLDASLVGAHTPKWRAARSRCRIPPQRHRHHCVKANVRVHEYPDGRLANLRRAELPGPLRSSRQAHRCPGRLTPLGGRGLGLMNL